MNVRQNKMTMALVLSASFILAAVLAVLLLLGTGWGMNLVRQAVLRNVQDQINGQITIERIASGMRTHLAVRGVSLRLTESQGGTEVLGADEIRIGFNVWDALVDEAPLYSVDIDGLRMAYFEDAAGSGKNALDLLLEGPARGGEAAGSPEGESSGLPIDLRDLRIRNGQFRYFDSGDSTAVSAGEVGFRGALLRPFKVNGEIAAGHVAFNIGGYEDAVTNMEATVGFEEDALTIHDMTMEFAHGPSMAFHATGEISTAQGNPATLDFAANGQVDAILRVIGFENTMPGIFTMTGSLRNSLSDPDVKTRFTSPVVRSEYGPFNLAAVDMAYGQHVLTVSRFRGKHEAGWISGRGLLDFSGESTVYRLQMESPGIALQALPSALSDSGSELEGEVDLAFEMEGRGFDGPPRRADLNASSHLVSIDGLPLREVTATAEYRRGLLRADLREASFRVDAEGRLGADGDLQLTGSVDVNETGYLPAGFAAAADRPPGRLDQRHGLWRGPAW